MSNTCRRWTQEEKDFVEEMWGEYPIKRIAKHLNRTEVAIKRYAERNQLGGAMLNCNYLSTGDASKIVGVDIKTIQTWVKDKKLKAKTKTLNKRHIVRIDYVDLLEFMKANPDRWNATKIEAGTFSDTESWFVKKLKEDAKKRDKKDWTLREEDRMISLFEQGLNCPQIAEIMERSKFSIRKKKQRLMHQGRLAMEV